MWGRRRRTRQATTVTTTLPPTGATPILVSSTTGTEFAAGSTLSLTVEAEVAAVTWNGLAALRTLARQGKLTEQVVYQSTSDATQDQQKAILDLLLRHKAGTVGAVELADELGAIMAATSH